MEGATGKPTIYMLDDNEYGSTAWGPYLGASGIDFKALGAEYRAFRYAEEEAKESDFCSVDVSGFVGWLIQKSILQPMNTVTVDIEISTDGDAAYVPQHWPLCPACEEGRGEPKRGEVKYTLNAVEAYRECTECGHEWDQHLEQWCYNKPMVADDGRCTQGGCVPYSISQVSGLPFPDVLDACRRYGFQEGQGMDEDQALAAMQQLGLIVTPGCVSKSQTAGGKLTLRRFLNMASSARNYIVAVRGHWLAVVGGENRDQSDTGVRAEVLRFWEVKRSG